MLGGGGSILTTPILVYVLGLPADEAIATSLVVVGMTSAGATVGHARRGDVEWRTGLAFGGAGMVGAYLGGRLGDLVPANVLLGLFGGFMLVTAAAMFRGRREPPPDAPRRPQWRFATDGVLVGVLTGLLGAGGGFVVVPALALLGGLPMRRAVATSLLVITLNTVAGLLGQLSHVAVDWPVAGSLGLTALAGSVVGTRLGARVPQEQLRRGFAALVLVMGAFVVVKELW
jgi:uncharacterized membrane protein YfcA